MTTKLTVPSIVCEACVDTVTKAIQQADAQAQVVVDLETKQVTIESPLDATTLTEAITAAGHEVA